MSITPLSAVRIAGEVGLAGGTATGGAFAAHYGKQLGESGKKINEYENNRKTINGENHKFTLGLSGLGSSAMEAEEYCKDRNLNESKWSKCEEEIMKMRQKVTELQGLMQGKIV